jgi:hypothetical protein
MLSESQASEIVKDSLQKVSGKGGTASKSIAELGFDDKIKLNELIVTITSDSKVGVPRFQHDLSVNKLIDELVPEMSIEELTDKVHKLAAGKLCSNPANPHEQKCCPYPATCPQCGYPVI